MKPTPPLTQGEVLTLGPPCSGELVITVDPRLTGTPFAAGTETLLPGAHIPVHRHLRQDEVLFVYKGQGRITLDGRAITVVSGMMLYVPRQTWHGVRNTGTGVLHMTWTVAPPGLEEFFRECSRLGPAAGPGAVQELASRHGMEFRPEIDAAEAGPAVSRWRRHRGRRGGRGPKHGEGLTPQPVQSPQSVPRPGEPPPATAASSIAPELAHRRRHQRSRRPPRASAPPPSTTLRQGQERPAESQAGSSHPERVQRPQTARRTGRHPPPARRRGRHGGQLKEVYMGGRWIRVVGEGPVIAPGPEQERRHPKRPGGTEGASGPFSVPL
ncbi:MAG: cupin domain-containing protein [Candidatus Omnitrophica bacterium]|nr:cupin domain-containing protein [Candidatus Omnitrophota bacterium]